MKWSGHVWTSKHDTTVLITGPSGGEGIHTASNAFMAVVKYRIYGEIYKYI